MLVFPDEDLRVVISFSVFVFVGPFSVLAFPSTNGLAVLIDAIIVEIGDDESGIIWVSAFNDAKIFGFRESEHLHRDGVIESILVVDLHNLLGLKVDDVNFAFGDVANNDFFVVDHSEEIDYVFVPSFVENFSGVIGVDDRLVGSRGINPDEDEGIFIGD